MRSYVISLIKFWFCWRVRSNCPFPLHDELIIENRGSQFIIQPNQTALYYTIKLLYAFIMDCLTFPQLLIRILNIELCILSGISLVKQDEVQILFRRLDSAIRARTALKKCSACARSAFKAPFSCACISLGLHN